MGEECITLVGDNFCFVLLIYWPHSVMNLGVAGVAKTENLAKSALGALDCGWPLLALLTLDKERLGGRHCWVFSFIYL
jgi:hypothetical protein